MDLRSLVLPLSDCLGRDFRLQDGSIRFRQRTCRRGHGLGGLCDGKEVKCEDTTGFSRLPARVGFAAAKRFAK